MTAPSQSDLQQYARWVKVVVAPFDSPPVITNISRTQDGITVLTASDGRVCLVGDETLAAIKDLS